MGIERSSGILFAVPIETKADAMKAVKGAVAKLERQLGERLRVIRSDGGTEFGGGEAIEWFKTTGIQHYTTPRLHARTQWSGRKDGTHTQGNDVNPPT